jgi:regulatory protein YycH of two-component signal transduction system YycFG
MHALRKNLEAIEHAERKQRESDSEKMLQRYQNVKKALENQQNVERVKLEKLIGNKMQAN